MSHYTGRGKRPPTSPRAGVTKKGKNNARARRDPDDIYDNDGKILHDGNSPLYQYGTNVRDIVEHPLVEATLGDSSPIVGITPLNIRTGVSNFQDDGRRGFNDPDFLRQAVEASGQRSRGDFDNYLNSRFNENWVDEEDDAEYARSEDEDTQENDDGSFAVQQPKDHVPSLPYRKEDRDDDDPSRSATTQTSIFSHRSSGFTESSPSNGNSSKGTSNGVSNGAMLDVSFALSNETSHYANLAAVPHPPFEVMKSHISVQKMDALWRLDHPDQQSFPGTLLQAGDILRFQEGAWIKDVRLISFLSATATVELPAAGNQTFVSGHPVVRLTGVSGPITIAKAIRQMEINAPFNALSGRIWNADIKVYRNHVYLGLLSDIRQAYQFHVNEAKWFAALKFQGCGIRFRPHEELLKDGYWIDSKMGVLCKKISTQWFQYFDQSTVIDLGQPLNSQLADCADTNSGCTIVFADIRVLCPGLPFSKEQNQTIHVPHGNPDTLLSKAWFFGPASFATQFLQTLASRGNPVTEWSKGHAHITPDCLYSNSSLWASGKNPPLHQSPAEVRISTSEKLKILAFWEACVKHKVEHWPISKNRAGVSHSDIIATQRTFASATIPFTAYAMSRPRKQLSSQTRSSYSSPDLRKTRSRSYNSAPQTIVAKVSNYRTSHSQSLQRYRPDVYYSPQICQIDKGFEEALDNDAMENLTIRSRKTAARSPSPNPYASAILLTKKMYGEHALSGKASYNGLPSSSQENCTAPNDCIDPALEDSILVSTISSTSSNVTSMGHKTIANVPYRSSRFANTLKDSALEYASSSYLAANHERPGTSGSDRPTTSSSFASNIANGLDRDTSASEYQTAASELDEDATIWGGFEDNKTPLLIREQWRDSNADQSTLEHQACQEISSSISLQMYNTAPIQRTLFEFMTGIPEVFSTPLMKQRRYLYENLTVKPGTRTQFRALLLKLPDAMLGCNDRENLYLGVAAQLKYNEFMHMPEKRYRRACWETVVKGGPAQDHDPHKISQEWTDKHGPCEWLVGDGQVVIARSASEAAVAATVANKHDPPERYSPSPYF